MNQTTKISAHLVPSWPQTGFVAAAFSRRTWSPGLKRNSGDLPGSPGVETPRFQCRGSRFDPWSGNSEPTCHVAQQKKKNKNKTGAQPSPRKGYCCRDPHPYPGAARPSPHPLLRSPALNDHTLILCHSSSEKVRGRSRTQTKTK